MEKTITSEDMRTTVNGWIALPWEPLSTEVFPLWGLDDLDHRHRCLSSGVSVQIYDCDNAVPYDVILKRRDNGSYMFYAGWPTLASHRNLAPGDTVRFHWDAVNSRFNFTLR